MLAEMIGQPVEQRIHQLLISETAGTARLQPIEEGMAKGIALHRLRAEERRS